jgi:hypothetical protein
VGRAAVAEWRGSLTRNAMENLRFVESAYRIQHKHGDGSWSPMEEEPRSRHHTSVEHDPDRSWLRGRIFKCSSCDETMTVVEDSEGGPSEPAGLVGGSGAETARHVVEDR